MAITKLYSAALGHKALSQNTQSSDYDVFPPVSSPVVISGSALGGVSSFGLQPTPLISAPCPCCSLEFLAIEGGAPG